MSKAHVWVWTFLTGALVATGGLAMVIRLGWLPTLVSMAFGIVVVGACVLTVAGDGRRANLLALRTGVLVSSVVVAAAGLARLIGLSAYVVAALVGLGWPGLHATVIRATRRLRNGVGGASPPGRPPVRQSSHAVPGTVDMSAFEAMVLDVSRSAPDDDRRHPVESPLQHMPADEVCRLWRRTYILLAQDIPPEMVMQLLKVREQCLQELMIREPGAYRQLIESGATPASDLQAFFHGNGRANSA